MGVEEECEGGEERSCGGTIEREESGTSIFGVGGGWSLWRASECNSKRERCKNLGREDWNCNSWSYLH